jgi:hypothetical protein
MYLEQQLVRPRKDLTSEAGFGGWALFIASILALSGCIILPETIWPKFLVPKTFW